MFVGADVLFALSSQCTTLSIEAAYSNMFGILSPERTRSSHTSVSDYSQLVIHKKVLVHDTTSVVV